MNRHKSSWEFLDTAFKIQFPKRFSSYKAILVALSYRANDNGECWPGIDLLCQMANVGRDTACKANAYLKLHGLMDWKPGRQHFSNHYYLSLDEMKRAVEDNRLLQQSIQAAQQSDESTPEPNSSSRSNRFQQSIQAGSAVRRIDTNPIEPSFEPALEKKKKTVASLPGSVDSRISSHVNERECAEKSDSKYVPRQQSDESTPEFRPEAERLANIVSKLQGSLSAEAQKRLVPQFEKAIRDGHSPDVLSAAYEWAFHDAYWQRAVVGVKGVRTFLKKLDEIIPRSKIATSLNKQDGASAKTEQPPKSQPKADPWPKHVSEQQYVNVQGTTMHGKEFRGALSTPNYPFKPGSHTIYVTQADGKREKYEWNFQQKADGCWFNAPTTERVQ